MFRRSDYPGRRVSCRNMWRNYRLNFLELSSDPALRDLQIVVILQIEPQLRRGTKGLAQAKGRVGGNAYVLGCNALNARTRQVHLAGERAGRQLERNKKLLAENFSGMHGAQLPCHGLSLHGLSLHRQSLSGLPESI